MSGVRFTEDQSTNLATLYGRALDARAEHPVLGDPTAEDAVRRIDYDFGKFKISKAEAFGIAAGARCSTASSGTSSHAHDECTVLHLGAGMDSRVFRLDPPPTVRWFDVDFPGRHRPAAAGLPGTGEHHHDRRVRGRPRLARRGAGRPADAWSWPRA